MVLCVADEKFTCLQTACFPNVLSVFVVPAETWPIFWFAKFNVIARHAGGGVGEGGPGAGRDNAITDDNSGPARAGRPPGRSGASAADH